MINILGDTSQRHYFRKDNCENYVKTQKIMQIVNIARNGNTCIIENSKNFVKKAVCFVNHSMCKVKPMIGAGIKSLDPPCFCKASPFGSHSYTCDACWNSRVGLKDVLNKKKKSRLILGKSCIGVCGFRKSYASKSETKVKSEELNAENVSLKRENRILRRLYLDKKSWGEMLADACNTANEEKLVIDLLGLDNQPKPLQFEVLKNLIDKMKSKTKLRIYLLFIGTTLARLIILCSKIY